MEYMGVATGCGVRRYIDFLILLIPTPLVYSCINTFCSFFKMFYIYKYYVYQVMEISING